MTVLENDLETEEGKAIISSMEYNDYILIGNFGLDYDALNREFLNASSNYSFKDFFDHVKTLSDQLGLEIVEFFDNYVVLKGDAQDVEYFNDYFGTIYSCAYVDKKDLSLASDCEDGTYAPETPGATKFLGPQAQSEISIKTAPINPKMRYDA